MKFCEKCGQQVNDDMQFCPNCGHKFILMDFQNKFNQEYTENDKDTGEIVYSSRTRLVAGLLQIFLGGFGIGRFYTGHTGIAVAQLIVSIITCGIGSLWGFVDGIIIIASKEFYDADGKFMKMS